MAKWQFRSGSPTRNVTILVGDWWLLLGKGGLPKIYRSSHGWCVGLVKFLRPISHAGGAKERGEATSVGSIAHMQPEDRLKMGKKRRSPQGSWQGVAPITETKGKVFRFHYHYTRWLDPSGLLTVFCFFVSFCPGIMQDMVDTSHESVQFAGVQWKKDKFKNSKFVTL